MKFKILNKVKLIYNKIVSFLKQTNNKIFGHKSYEKFVIISGSRTGSTLLMALLNNHSNIICEGELFKNLNGKTCTEIWEALFNNKPKKVKQVGFKLFYYHPFDEDKSIWNIILKDNNINIIHLTRKNLLRIYASQEIGKKTKQWTENINRPHGFDISTKHVELDYETCLNTFETIVSYEEKIRQMFNNREIIEVDYEDLSADYSLSINHILQRFKLPSEELTTVMKKQNPEPLRDLVTNYEQLKSNFKNTKWEYLFNE
jgi:LPS sulfotransferase NodH